MASWCLVCLLTESSNVGRTLVQSSWSFPRVSDHWCALTNLYQAVYILSQQSRITRQLNHTPKFGAVVGCSLHEMVIELKEAILFSSAKESLLLETIFSSSSIQVHRSIHQNTKAVHVS